MELELPEGGVRADASSHAQPSPPASAAPPSEEGDGALVDAIRTGNRQFGPELYRTLAHVIDRTLCRVLGPGTPEHDDLVQMVFEQVIISIRRGGYARRCSLRSWAASIACNVGLNAIRSRRTERSLFDRHQSADDESLRANVAESAEQRVAAREELDRLRKILAQMSEARANSVVLSDVLGYGLAEIAAISECSLAAAESRLTRGRRELAERLARAEAEQKP